MELASAGISLQRLLDLVRRGQRVNVTTVSADYTLTAGDDVVRVDTTSASVTITIPSAFAHPGKVWTVVKIKSANTVTLQRSGTDLLNDATSDSWTTRWQSKTIVSGLNAAPAVWGYTII